MTVTFDSSAWIEYFSGSDLGQIIKEYIDNQETIYTPSIALLEIKSKYQREDRKWKSRIDFIYEQSSIIDLDHKVALLGADMKKDYGLYSIDAISYGSARSIKSKLLTKDRHFKGLKSVIILQ